MDEAIYCDYCAPFALCLYRDKLSYERITDKNYLYIPDEYIKFVICLDGIVPDPKLRKRMIVHFNSGKICVGYAKIFVGMFKPWTQSTKHST